MKWLSFLFKSSVFAVALITTSAQVCLAQTPRDDKKIIEDVRNSYSVLKRDGIVDMRATMKPVWTSLLKEIPADKRKRVERLTNRLVFSIHADTSGKVEVTHTILGPKPDKATADTLNELSKNVEVSAQGFLLSYVPFMLSYLIPEKLENFVLQDLESQYVLSFTENKAEVSVVMDKELRIAELKTAQGIVKPELLKTGKGYALKGYESTLEDPILGSIRLKVNIETLPLQGFALPTRVVLNTSYGARTVNFELLFSNYKLKLRV